MRYEQVDWLQANCAGTDADMFYYNAHESELMIENTTEHNNPYTITNEYLSKVCGNCPIMVECFEYALLHEEHGYWGGTSSVQRKAMRKTLGITLQETYSPDKMDDAVLQLRQRQAELLQVEEELYEVH